MVLVLIMSININQYRDIYCQSPDHHITSLIALKSAIRNHAVLDAFP